MRIRDADAIPLAPHPDAAHYRKLGDGGDHADGGFAHRGKARAAGVVRQVTSRWR